MEEGFFLDGIALQRPHVSPWDVKFPAAIEANLADASLPLSNGTAMPAGKAANTVPLNGLVKLAFPDVLVEYFAEGGQRKPLPPF